MDSKDGAHSKDEAQEGGQVSETAGRGGELISSGDSVAGQPEQESGEVDEGAQGPNAIPDDPTGQHPHQAE